MTKYAEDIFEPKRILTSGDWLQTQREPDQYYESYKQGKLNIKWVNEVRNKIHLFACDNSFTDAQLVAYKKYVNAFFTGIKGVEIMKAGQVIPGQNPNKAGPPRKAPVDFLEREIESRDGYEGKQYKCCGKNGILTKLPAHRPPDSYSCLCITMKDLYPGPKWGFCFGWASYTEGVGGFSFCRFDPAWDGITDPDSEKNLLMRACAIMCHEIGHQFGLRHCIYYECLMNGIMSAEEQRAGGIRILCPVCTKKLKQNLKFDSAVRFQRLAAVCDELDFADEAAVYRKLLIDAGQPTVEVPSASNLLGLDSAQPQRGRTSSGSSSASTVKDKRSTSNANTTSRTNKLVGANIQTRTTVAAATNAGPARKAVVSVRKTAAASSVSPKGSKATGKAIKPKIMAFGGMNNQMKQA